MADRHPTFDTRPLQLGMEMDVWSVVVASMLLCRTRRVQAGPALEALLRRWPTPADLARADTEELEQVVRPCGLYRNRARMLQRFSVRFMGEGWHHLQELSGVGKYVADAVGVFCFGEKDIDSDDYALRKYVNGTVRATESVPGGPHGGA